MFADFEAMHVANPNILSVDKRTGIVVEDVDGDKVFVSASNDTTDEIFSTHTSLYESEDEDMSNEGIACAPQPSDFFHQYNKTSMIHGNKYDFTSQHAVSVCAKVVGPSDMTIHFLLFTYIGDDVGWNFIDYSEAISQHVFKNWILPDRPMIITPEEQLYHETTWVCHICEGHIHDVIEVCPEGGSPVNTTFYCCRGCDKQFLEKIPREETKVYDHSHVSSKYRGPAHFRCNKAYRLVKESWELPIFFS